MKKAYRQHGKDPLSMMFPHGIFAGYRAGCRCEKCTEAHRVYKREYMAAYRLLHPEFMEAERKDKVSYRQTLKGKSAYRISNRIRQGRRRTATARATKEERKMMRIIYAMCPAGFHVDHKIPLSKGGRHVPENLQYLPAKVNLSKRNSISEVYQVHALAWQDFIVQ